jgi:hypothetical protein
MPVLFTSESILMNCGGKLGYPDGSLFVMSDDEAFDLLNGCNYDLSAVCKRLMVPVNAWTGQKVFAVQIPSVHIRNLRISSGNEAGADANWIPNGVHPSGFKQAVIDPVALKDCEVMEIQWKS